MPTLIHVHLSPWSERARWALDACGIEHERVGRWHERNLQRHEFPARRPSSDELKDLVDWAFKKLTPGGPDRRPADDRGRYTARHDAIAAVLSFLTSEEAHLSPWYGTQADLAAAATAWAAERGHTLTVTRDSLQKLLPELQEEHGLFRVIEREGRTWITRWALRAAYTADAPEPPETPDRPEAEGQVIPLHDLPSSPGSEREMLLSIRRPQVDPPDPSEGRGELNPEKQVKPVLSEVPRPAPSPSTSLRNPPGSPLLPT